MATTVTAAPESARFSRLGRALEWPMAILAVAVVPALIVEDRTTSASVRNIAIAVNWIAWLAFVTEFVVKVSLTANPRRFVRHHWFDLLLIVVTPPFLVPDALQSVRSVRAVRALRLLRVLRAGTAAAVALRNLRGLLNHRGLAYVLCVGMIAVTLGALGIYLLEQGETIHSLADAYWWAIVTVTTVGYGDVSPKTGEGRLIAVALMFVGIGVISVFTATLASFFFSADEQSEAAQLEQRLEQIEAKLDLLLKERK
jgi:voltage-gated potassium channel